MFNWMTIWFNFLAKMNEWHRELEWYLGSILSELSIVKSKSELNYLEFAINKVLKRMIRDYFFFHNWKTATNYLTFLTYFFRPLIIMFLLIHIIHAVCKLYIMRKYFLMRDFFGSIENIYEVVWTRKSISWEI